MLILPVRHHTWTWIQITRAAWLTKKSKYRSRSWTARIPSSRLGISLQSWPWITDQEYCHRRPQRIFLHQVSSSSRSSAHHLLCCSRGFIWVEPRFLLGCLGYWLPHIRPAFWHSSLISRHPESAFFCRLPDYARAWTTSSMLESWTWLTVSAEGN